MPILGFPPALLLTANDTEHLKPVSVECNQIRFERALFFEVALPDGLKGSNTSALDTATSGSDAMDSHSIEKHAVRDF